MRTHAQRTHARRVREADTPLFVFDQRLTCAAARPNAGGAADVPAVPQDAGLSADLCDFVASCLRKEPAQRPTVTELQAHRWMKRFDSDEMDLSMKLEDVKL